MELRHVRSFVAVAEELHFGRAAKRLGIAQPPLSQQIKRLEAELGVVLFHRTRRRVELTEAGRALLEEGRRLLAQAERTEQAAQRAHRGEVGRLEVGFVGSATYGPLPAILRAYRAAYPDVDLGLRQLTTAEQVAALLEGGIGVGLLRPPAPAAVGVLAVETVQREEVLVALPQSHLLADWRRIPAAELAEEPFVLFPRAAGPGLYDQIVAICGRAGFVPTVAQEATEMATIIGLVAGGLGVSLVPASVRRLARPDVAFRPLDPPTPPALELAVAWRRGDPSAVLRGFLATVRGIAGDRSAQT